MFKQPYSNKQKRGQGIVKVSDLFLKYTKILKAPQGSVIAVCLEVFADMHLPVKKEHLVFQVQSRTLVVKAPGAIKSEIMLHKKTILDEIARRIGKVSAPKDIL